MTGSNRLCHGGLFAAPSGFARNYGTQHTGRRTANFQRTNPKDNCAIAIATYVPTSNTWTKTSIASFSCGVHIHAARFFTTSWVALLRTLPVFRLVR